MRVLLHGNRREASDQHRIVIERRTTDECLLGTELVVVQSGQEIEARVTSMRHATQSKVEKSLTDCVVSSPNE